MADSEFALGPPQSGRGKSTFRCTAKYEATVIGAMSLYHVKRSQIERDDRTEKGPTMDYLFKKSSRMAI